MAAGKDITTKFKLQGSDDGTQVMLRQVADKLERIEQKATKAGRAGKQAGQETKSGMDGAHTSLVATAAKFATIGAAVGTVRAAFSAWKEDLSTTLAQVEGLAEAAHNLLFFEEFMKGGPGGTMLTQRDIEQAAVDLKVNAEELASAKELLISMTSGTSEPRRAELEKEAAEYRQTVNLPMPEIVTLFAKIESIYGSEKSKKRFGDLSANEIQSVVRQTVKMAAVTPQQLAPQLPRTLATGVLTGTDIREITALLAGATKITGSAEKASGAIEQVGKVLAAMKTPEQQRLGKIAGFAPGDDMIDQLEKLGAAMAAATITEGEFVGHFGEGASQLLEIVRDMSTVRKQIAEMREQTAPDKDPTRADYLQRLRGDPAYFARQTVADAKRREEQERGKEDVEGRQVELMRINMAIRGRAAGRGALLRGMDRAVAESMVYAGVSPESAFRLTRPSQLLMNDEEQAAARKLNQELAHQIGALTDQLKKNWFVTEIENENLAANTEATARSADAMQRIAGSGPPVMRTTQHAE